MRSFLFIILFISCLQINTFSQVEEWNDSLITSNLPVKKTPILNYSIGSRFTYIPGLGSISGMNVSAFYKHQVNPKFYVLGGLIASRNYVSLKNQFENFSSKSSFNDLSVYGSAVYNLNQKLSIYGTGTRQLLSSTPFFEIPKYTYSFGSNIDFGNFSIGAEIRFVDYSNSTSPFGGNYGYFPTQSW